MDKICNLVGNIQKIYDVKCFQNPVCNHLILIRANKIDSFSVVKFYFNIVNGKNILYVSLKGPFGNYEIITLNGGLFGQVIQ
jgi:hypothetical protein